MFHLLVAASFACPTIATGTPSSLSFDTAQVAIVRQDGRTTFSVSVNPFGDKQTFALVLPVPKVLAEDEIKTLDGTIFADLDAYSAPRHVEDAGCPRNRGGDTAVALDGDAEEGDDGAGSVDVEAEYLIGDYQIVILSAEESAGLAVWLDTNGYHLPPGAEPMLAEYIEAGRYFMAAKVAEAASSATGEPLSPLQVTYESEVFAIPIRLALLNSPGLQDLVIYSLTDRSGPDDAGRVGIANYTEFDVPDRCVWGGADDDFNAFYEGQFEDAWNAVGDAAWTVEYAGAYWDCNPCSSVTISEEQLRELGFAGDPYEHHLTRIRMRYTPEQATQDLVLYGSGMEEPEVTAYADDNEQNYTCVEYFCDGTDTPDDDWDDDGARSDDEAEEAKGGWGCATAPTAPAALLLVAAGLVRRRRD